MAFAHFLFSACNLLLNCFCVCAFFHFLYELYMPLCSFFLPDILESATFHCRRRHHHWRSSFSLNVLTMFHGPWIIITLKFRIGYTVSVTHSLNARRTDDMIERNSVNITLHDVDPTALRQLIDYTYTGEITITEDNVQVTNLIKYLPSHLFPWLCFPFAHHYTVCKMRKISVSAQR